MHLSGLIFAICIVNTYSLISDQEAERINREWVEKADSFKGKAKAVDVSNCSLDQTIVDEIHSYQDNVNTIIESFLTGAMKGKAYNMLAEMTDSFGPRLVN